MSSADGASFRAAQVVWVKLGPTWWPGQVTAHDPLPAAAPPPHRKAKPPLAIVKFFQEDTVEYVKNLNMIDDYRCERKNDFIKKGLQLHRAKHAHMEKFPEDVKTAETLTNGNPNICDDPMFAPEEKTSYAGLFGSPAASTSPKKNAAGKRGRPASASKREPAPKITHPRILQKYLKGTSDYKARILVQENKKEDFDTSDKSFDDPDFITKEMSSPSTSKMSSSFTSPQSSDMYTCHSCNFTSTRLNVMILHNKSHGADASPKTKTPSIKAQKKTVKKEVKTTPTPVKSKPRGRPKKSATDETCTPAKVPKMATSPPRKPKEEAKPKTDVEIKCTLLADWTEDSNESVDLFTSLKLSGNQQPNDSKEPDDSPSKADEPKDENESDKKLETRASCFDFDEDEDLSIETIGRKIPRLSKTESKKTPDPVDLPSAIEKSPVKTKPVVEDSEEKTEDLDSEIKNLLEETAVPEVPNIPNQLKFTENFQKGKAIKFPDKGNEIEEKPPSKAIFKTKTFFRSRHSRSQDAIEKYIADNTTNARSPIYGDEQPDAKNEYDSINEYSISDELESSKTEEIPDVKTVKLAPKIELKKMKAALSDKLQKQVNEVVESLDSKVSKKLMQMGKPNVEDEIISPKKMTEISKSKSEDSFETEKIVPTETSDPPKPTERILRSKAYTNDNKIKSPQASKCVPQTGKEKILNFDIDRNSPNPIKQEIVLKRADQNELKAAELKASQEQLYGLSKLKDKWKNSETFTIKGASETLSVEPTVKKVEKKILNNTLPPQTDNISENSMMEIDSTSPILSDNTIIEKTTKSSIESSILSTTVSEIKSLSNHNIMTSPSVKSVSDTFISKPSNILLKPIMEKSPSPNILSKSKSKAGLKQLIIVDSNGAKKQIVLPKDIQDTPLLQAAANIIKQPGNVLSNNTEKFLIVSSDSNNSLPVAKRQPRIIRSPQSGKTQILLNTTELPKSQTISKLIPSRAAGDNSTLMIITNADKQPKYILTPEPSKIVLPKKQNTTQTILIPKGTIQHVKGKAALSQTLISNRGQISQISGNTLITSTGQIIPTQSQMSTTTNTRTILTAKPNQAILTSRGQLITESNILTAQSKNVLTKSPPVSGQQLKFISKVQMNKESEFPNQNIILQQSSNMTQVPPLLMKSSQKKVIATQQISKVPKGGEQTILLSPNQGTILTMTAAQFEQLKKSGQLIIQSDDKIQQPKIIQKVTRPKPKIQTYSAANRISPPPLAMVKNDAQPPVKKSKFQTETIPKPEVVPPKNVNVLTKSLVPPQSSDGQQSILDLQNLDELIPATTITTRKVDQLGNPIVPDNSQILNQDIPQLNEAEAAKPNSNQDILAAAASGSLGDGLLAVPGENFGGPPNSFYLCMEENGTFTPINDQPLVLEDNQLVPMITKPVSNLSLTVADESAHLPIQLETAPLPEERKPIVENQQLLVPAEQPEANILINFGNQQILIDQQTLLSLTSGDGQQLVTADGQLLLQGQLQQILTALASNPEISKMMTSNTQEVQVIPAEPQIITDNSSYTFTSSIPNTGNQDILAAALANTDVFHQDPVISDDLNISTVGSDSMIIEMDSLSPNFHNLNASVSVHSHVSETSSTLNQPIMSPVEIPTKKKILHKNSQSLLTTSQVSEMMIPQNIEDSLAVIGVTPPSIPSSLDLPITVTNPKIAPKTTNPLTLSCGVVYQSNNTIVSPSTVVSDVEGYIKLDAPICSIGSDDTRKNTPYLLTTIDSKLEETVENTIPEFGNTSMPSLDDNSAIEDKDTKVYSPISMPLLTDVDENTDIPSDDKESPPVEEEQTKISSDEITFDESIKTNITDITEETCEKETSIIQEDADAKDGIPNSESPSKPDAETDYDLDSEIQPSSVPSETCDSLEQPNSPYAILNMVSDGQIINDNNCLSEEFNVGCDLDESNIENSLSQCSDASSACSDEIPLLPSISVSENLIRNLAGTENNSSDETNGVKRYSDEEDLINGDESPLKKSKYER